MRRVSVYLLFWLVLMLLAIGNGFLREATYGQSLSELHSHQLSTVTAMVTFGIAVFLLSRYLLPKSAGQAMAIGVIWLALTLCFEFFLVHYVLGHSWDRLFQDYNVSLGRVWPFLLVWITCLPYVAYRCRTVRS